QCERTILENLLVGAAECIHLITLDVDRSNYARARLVEYGNDDFRPRPGESGEVVRIICDVVCDYGFLRANCLPGESRSIWKSNKCWGAESAPGDDGRIFFVDVVDPHPAVRTDSPNDVGGLIS